MITLNNSNIDFGFEDESLGSKYSISLSHNTSNFVFRTDGVERMTIMKNGKVGIGTVGGDCDLDVNGSINASVYLINGADISTITSDTNNYIDITSNLLISRIIHTSNYVTNTSNLLISRIRDTSNYVKDTSNILIGIIDNTSNYVGITSNILVGRIVDTSNYVASTSNILVGRIIDTKNYVSTTSNILVGRISDTSNYVKITSNILVDRIVDTINYARVSSNNLIVSINDTSNYIDITSNTLVRRIMNTSNYVKDTSNILIGRVIDTSNYVGITSNILVGRIVDTSNYVASTSNILVGRIVDTSNYVASTSNILVGHIIYTSNYVSDTSNILAGRIVDTSNYVCDTSNILVGRINDTSNYIKNTSNLLISLNNTSNYVKITCNYMVDLINSSKINRWGLNKNMIYYNNYNVGIGTNNPVSKLHLYDDTISETKLTINSTFEIIPSPNEDIISGIINDSTDRYMIFKNATKLYSFTILTGGLNCDILMIGGGGAGMLGGGGAGACIVAINQTLPAGSCIVSVGSGGTDFTTNGGDSYIKIGATDRYRAKGGGRGGNTSSAGSNGGCGGGGGSTSVGTSVYSGGVPLTTNVVNGTVINSVPPVVTSTYAVFGTRGGQSSTNTNTVGAGGGGGIGELGGYSTFNTGNTGGKGIYSMSFVDAPTPINFRNHFANGNTLFGIQDGTSGNYYIGGGGGGIKNDNALANNGLGGGGASFANSGSGGRSRYVGTSDGATGIVIIRYRLPVIPSLSIEFKNFTTNYTIGNTEGNFKITSTVSEQTNHRLVITPSGFVGIGTTNSSYMLEVLDNTSPTPVSFRNTGYYFRNNSLTGTTTTTISQYTPTSRICAKFNDSILLTGGTFVISSDIRIKENIQDINDNSVLQKFLAIKPKTYKYIDKIKKGDSMVYGFIAQQVKNVIPDAVNIEKSHIPNIMLDAKYNKNIIILPYKPTKVTIKIKDKIKCYDSENKIIEVEVYEIINEVSFKIKDLDKEYTSNNIFVYGTYVDDFHTLFTDNIFTLNVGATHELYRQIKKQKEIIRMQDKRIDVLEIDNDELENKFKNLLKELELIKVI